MASKGSTSLDEMKITYAHIHRCENLTAILPTRVKQLTKYSEKKAPMTFFDPERTFF